jgi:hypothetical protein
MTTRYDEAGPIFRALHAARRVQAAIRTFSTSHKFPRLLVRGACLGSATAFIAALGYATAPSGHYTTQNVSGVNAVVDTKTGLVWQQAVAGATADGGAGFYTWAQAQAYCTSLGGSRLPSVEELLTIVDETTSNPTIDTGAFPNTPAEPFWTLSPFAGTPPGVWYVNFMNGYAVINDVGSQYRVRCVR